MKRTERKHLKEDGFVSGMNRFIRFAKAYEKEMLTALGVVLLLAVGYVVLVLIQGQQAKKQSYILGEIIRLSEAVESDPAALEKLEDISGQGGYARVGYIHLAGYWLEQGDPDRAESYAKKAAGSRRDLVSAQARMIKARIHVLRGDFEPALEIFGRLERENPRGFPLDAVLFEYAETLEKAGEQSRADEIYRRLSEEFDQTYFGYEAMLKLSRRDFR